MKHVLIIGSGLSGLSCAIKLAENGVCGTLVSPYPSERAQSVMAAGGINAALAGDDSPERHAEDTRTDSFQTTLTESSLVRHSRSLHMVLMSACVGNSSTSTSSSRVARVIRCTTFRTCVICLTARV